MGLRVRVACISVAHWSRGDGGEIDEHSLSSDAGENMSLRVSPGDGRCADDALRSAGLIVLGEKKAFASFGLDDLCDGLCDGLGGSGWRNREMCSVASGSSARKYP